MRLTIFALMLLASPSARAHDPGEATYLGNEGILVAQGATKILIDAFYAESFDGQYVLVPTTLETAMMKGEAPFDGIDAILFTHIHPDHFNSRKTIPYMRAHPKVRLYGGMDVVGAIRAADASSDPLMKRVVPVHTPPGGKPVQFAIDGLEIEAFAIPHNGDGPIPHFAYRVTLDAKSTIMHLGDADDEDRHYAPYQQDFDKKGTEAAFVPYWMLMTESGKRVLEQRIRPAKTIGIHVDAEERKDPAAARKQVGGDLFIEPGETRPISDQP
mgnify:CR=1 FL=1